MSELDLSPESKLEVPRWIPWLVLGLSNAGATFLLCVALLELPEPAGRVLFAIGLAAMPGAAATVAVRSSPRDRGARSSALAIAGYFALLFAIGVAIELATLWALLDVFWSGPQLGA